MTGIFSTLTLLCQLYGDTLRWYDPATAGWNAVNFCMGYPLHWAVIFPVDSLTNGRIVHSGRVHIWEALYEPGIMRLASGTPTDPLSVLDSGSFHSTGYGFYEVFFGDTILLNQGDTIWLWCVQNAGATQLIASIDLGPPVDDYGNKVSVDGGGSWQNLGDYSLNYNWVMELILTPVDVEEGPAEPGEKLALLPAPGGFWISGYSGLAQIYDPAGRLVLRKEVKAKTLIGPLRPGVYFVVAGRERARVAVR